MYYFLHIILHFWHNISIFMWIVELLHQLLWQDFISCYVLHSSSHAVGISQIHLFFGHIISLDSLQSHISFTFYSSILAIAMNFIMSSSTSICSDSSVTSFSLFIRFLSFFLDLYLSFEADFSLFFLVSGERWMNCVLLSSITTPPFFV